MVQQGRLHWQICFKCSTDKNPLVCFSLDTLWTGIGWRMVLQQRERIN